MKKKGIPALYLGLVMGLFGVAGSALAQTNDATPNAVASQSQTPNTDQGTVNINTATVQQLTQLQGIGARRAEAIVQYREEHGPFTDIDQLQEVAGIGPTLIENNRSRLSL